MTVYLHVHTKFDQIQETGSENMTYQVDARNHLSQDHHDLDFREHL